MNVQHTPPPRRRFPSGAVYVPVLVLLLSAPAFSQRGRRTDEVMRARNADMMRELENKRREGTIKTTSGEAPPAVISYEQGKEDFRRLQLVNNEMMRAVFSAKAAAPLDCRLVSESVSEIARRASRLKSNLQLPEPEGAVKRLNPPTVSDEEQLRAALLALDKLIMGFVTNPVFRNSGTVDARQSAAARQDLSQIIEFGRVIKSGAEKLRKARESGRERP